MANELSRLYRQFLIKRFPPLGLQISEGNFALYVSLFSGFLSRYEAGEHISIDEIPILELETDEAVATLLSKEFLDYDEEEFLDYFYLLEEMRRLLLKGPTIFDDLLRQSRDSSTSPIVNVPKWVIETQGFLDLLLKFNHFVVRIDLEPIDQVGELLRAISKNCEVPYSFSKNWNALKEVLLDFHWLETPPSAFIFLYAQPELLPKEVMSHFLGIFVSVSVKWAKKSIPFKLVCPNTFPISEYLGAQEYVPEALDSKPLFLSLDDEPHERISTSGAKQEYPYPDLLPQLEILCTPEEYMKLLVTPKDYLRKYRKHFIRSPGYIPYKNPNYWKIIPVYEYAECPICHTRISDPGDTYSIRAWGRSYASILLNALFGVAESGVPIGARCPHFLGIARYANLHGCIPDEVDGHQNEAGELPYITPQLLPQNIESYAILHALPICRIEGEQFVPRYTVFVLTYFARDPARVLKRIYEQITGPEYHGYAHLDPVGSRPTDLRPWGLTGKLGWLDYFRVDLPLKIGRGLTLPPIYQNIQGVNEEIYPGKAYLAKRRLKRK